MLRGTTLLVLVIVSVSVLGWITTANTATLGNSAVDLVYSPVTPCRIIDTRVMGGAILPALLRDFVVAGTQDFEAQGGTVGGCGIPDTATAAMLNFIAVNATGPGDLRVWPFGQPVPLASVINYAAVPGLNIANGAVVSLCDPATTACPFDMRVQADANATHLVVDVMGFFQSTAPRGVVVIGAPNTNTFLGFNAGNFTTTGSSNTGIGSEALFRNTTGNGNTATGSETLKFNTSGLGNTATGSTALAINTTGSRNTATGVNSLFRNTSGGDNTATGEQALLNNQTGFRNTATGGSALALNTVSSNNTATGVNALLRLVTGGDNTATGINALDNLANGVANIAVGVSAGTNLTGGSNNIHIGSPGASTETGVIRVGTSGTHTATFIQGIANVGMVSGGSVLINTSTGQLGVLTSSRRFKEDIRDLGGTRDLLRLRPVTFRYTSAGADGSKPLQYGLVAEEVAQVLPELVVAGPEGEPYSVRYELLSVLLLAELQRQGRELQTLRAQVEAWRLAQPQPLPTLDAGAGINLLEP